MASLVAVGGKILSISRDGDGGWIKAGPAQRGAGPEHRRRAGVRHSSDLVGDRIYIRSEKHLFAIAKTAS